MLQTFSPECYRKMPQIRRSVTKFQLKYASSASRGRLSKLARRILTALSLTWRPDVSPFIQRRIDAVTLWDVHRISSPTSTAVTANVAKTLNFRNSNK